MEDFLSPRQVALAIGVSEASIKRWCDRGLIRTSRTGGGHRRLLRTDVLHFLRQDRIPIVKPNLLGLPSMTGATEATSATVVGDLRAALVAGDRDRARSIVLNYYMSGRPAVETCDKVIAEAFHELGDRWQHGIVEIFEERRGCDIAMSILREMEATLPEKEDADIVAVCATPKGDRYEIPIAMVAITLKEKGCKAHKIGIDLPSFVIEKAIDKTKPAVLALSVSYIEATDMFHTEFQRIRAKTEQANCTLVVGGRALTDEVRKGLPYDVFCDDLARLATFVETLKKKPE